ncbi:hypothetical protein [Nocardioides insulae]|uniref:hypothetical protein n=1 Tax=Nocardioides insulae TaxID=394734 RepID=UPI0003F5DB47|nr:hypothetical protein [Nocardioides insulae]
MPEQDPTQHPDQSVAPVPGAHEPVYYRLAPAVSVRFVGLALVAVALLLFALTLVVAVAGWSMDLVVIAAVLGLAGVLVLGWWLRSRAYVLRCTPEGYTVRMVRSAGVTQARWTQVEDAVTVTRHEIPCVVLRLKEGTTTTIPVSVLGVDRERFVRELQEHLQRGNGLRMPPRGKRPRTP